MVADIAARQFGAECRLDSATSIPRTYGSILRPAPKPLGCELCSTGKRLELCPDDVFGDEFVAGEGAETAIGSADDALAFSHRCDRCADAVGNHFGMFEIVGRHVDDAGD